MWRYCYVDNIMLSANTVQEALEKYKASKRICADAQMNLREYASNSQEFTDAIPADDRANPDKLRDLGIPWQPTADDWWLPS
ncbi:Pao retrotransposon peptidase family protein [Aphelenchoides avenae]|nr:Pao retrotransposon peptidase family protein [Aphelenchus avenae]